MPKVEDSKIGAVVNCILILGLFALCWYWGFALAATALTDPDTCWLLALGKWIVEHGTLPTADPFSWTVGADAPASLYLQPAHYLPYQWLGSLIFFCIFQAFGATALLFFACILIVTSFLILPMLLARRLQVPLGWQAFLSVLAVSAGSFHFPLRPELFSYLLIALLFYLLLPLFFSDTNSKSSSAAASLAKSKLVPALLGLTIFCIWANLHSGFVLGLLIVFLFWLAALSCGSLDRGSQIGYMSCFSLGALAGTLITPFQLTLYSYLPGLFFSPMNKYNLELMPLHFSELLSSDYLPFLALQAIFTGSLVFYFFPWKKKKNTKLAVSDQRFPNNQQRVALIMGFFTLLSFISGDMCRRMIPFAVLMSSGYFLTTAHNMQSPCGFKWPLKFVLPLAMVLALWGTQLSAAFFHAEIPMTTYGFDGPKQALVFIQKQRPAGNLLNDPQFGDVLIFSLNEKARVFIDTRFDLYGPRLSRDYFVMANALPGYEALLERYKLDWIFLPPRARLISRLSASGRWSKIFEDKAAVILTKNSAAVLKTASPGQRANKNE